MTSQDGIEYYKLISRAKEELILAELQQFLPDSNLPKIIALLEKECDHTIQTIKTIIKNKKERLK